MPFEDFFWIKEDSFERVDSPRGLLKLKINSTKLQNPEVSDSDLRQPNPIAIPDILVSRINARQVAVMPDSNFRDNHNNGFLDRKGIPQSLVLNKRIVPKNFLKKDPAFERQLLVEYFDRNHEFRSKTASRSNRTAAVHYGTGLISGERLNSYLKKASPDFSKSVDFNNASLLDYVNFLRTPASLKGFSAHSSQWNSSYGKKYDVTKLESVAGGNPWRWQEKKVGNRYHYTPSFAQQGGAADSYIHRTIYENGLLKSNEPSLFIHIGCEVNTPANALRVPYSHKDYGSSNGFQNAESILFFLNGVALASRAKTFYDSPRGFTEELGKSPTSRFGDGWRAYFQVESEDENLESNVAGNKRTYPWSIIGDWTLQLK